jgi:hypothetical protein
MPSSFVCSSHGCSPAWLHRLGALSQWLLVKPPCLPFPPYNGSPVIMNCLSSTIFCGGSSPFPFSLLPLRQPNIFAVYPSSLPMCKRSAPKLHSFACTRFLFPLLPFHFANPWVIFHASFHWSDWFLPFLRVSRPLLLVAYVSESPVQ